YGAAAIPVEEIVNYDFVHEADLDGACSSGGREVRRERAHGRGLLQRRLRDVRHDQRDRNRDRRDRGCWLCRRGLRSAPDREALVVAVPSTGTKSRPNGLELAQVAGRARSVLRSS